MKSKAHLPDSNSVLQGAFSLHQSGALQEAEILYRSILKRSPGHVMALTLLGTVLIQRGQLLESVKLLNKSIKLDPAQALAHQNLGIALYELKKYDASLQHYDRVVKLNPNYADIHNNRANTLRKLSRLDEAIEGYDRAIALNPDYAEAYVNRGIVLNLLKRFEESLICFDQALFIKSGYAEAYFSRGNVFQDLRRFDEALTSYDQAIFLKPDYAEAYYNRGNVFRDLQRLNEALASYDRAIFLKPDYAEAYYNRGNVFQDLKVFNESLANYERAISLKPDYAEAHNNQGNLLQQLKQYPAALECYEKAMALKPDNDFYLNGSYLQVKMQICDWSNVERQLANLTARIELGEKASQPMTVLAITSSLALQKKAAEIWVKDKHPPEYSLPAISKYPKHDKIRIGYFSADFRNHAVSYLTAALFENHDKSRFELIAFSFGPQQSDEMRGRVAAAFDRFIDVSKQTDKEIALLARSLEIDIAVDLGGHTGDARTGIFAFKAAPLQVSYIGYLGTMGADYIDYIIADPVIIPEVSRQHYTEKIIYLPSYQANDSTRVIPDDLFTRAALGLPDSGFVFCCFNNNYKITPGRFDCWMRILKKVEGSVLFLYAENELAANNLKKEAVSRGVNADRLVFGKKMPVPEYLARYRMADLFLDTLPYNAGTTASDAMWAGLPVLTCTGEAFAGRVAASLLDAIHLPELITATQEEYEELAVELASNPEALARIKQKLAQNRLTTPLFNIQLFTRHIEAAYTEIYTRYQADLVPENVYVRH